MKIIKYAFYAAIVLAIALVAYIATTFNPNDYKQEVIDLVKKEKNRTLTIDGDISLSYWPKIGANLGKIAISEQNSDKEFASVNSAKVALSVMPLLKKELVVDTVYIDGAKANIVKYADGSTNFDDLLSDSKKEESSESVKFDVQGINITNTEVNYSDEKSGAKYAVSQFNMESGRIALATPVDLTANFHLAANQPAVNADVNVTGNFLADPETQHFIAKGLDAKVTGDLLDGKNVDIAALGSVDATLSNSTILVDALKVLASGEFDGANMNVAINAPALTVLKDQVSSNEITIALSQAKAGDNFKANLALSDMKGSPSAIQSSGITGDISGIQGQRQIAGTFSSPLKGDLEGLIFDLPKLVGNLNITDPALPNGEVQGDFNLNLHTDVKKEKVKSQFALNVESTQLDGNLAVASFKTPAINFNLNAGTLDLNQLLGANQPKSKSVEKTTSNEPPDLSALKTLNLDGHVKIDKLLYNKYTLSGLNVGVLANGKKLSLSGLNVQLDDSKIKGNFSISQFDNPLYRFLIDIDTLDANRYIASSDKVANETKTDENKPFDLSALQALNADGSIRIGNFKYDKTKASNIRIDLKAANGVTTVSPLSANLYGGSTNGSVKIDARSVPVFSINQQLNGINIGPLLHDSINNDMLSGKGGLSLNVTSTGNTVPSLKQSLGGKAALNLADGAIKGVDIAGTIRSIKSKANLFKGKDSVDSDISKKTDFSSLTASFNIKEGVATNNDLAMKAPILRLAKGDSRGTIDIGKEKIDYLAKPTVVKSIKGQGGEDLSSLAGFSIPVKVTGTFAAPKFGMDFAAIGKQAAKSKLIDKVAGSKSTAVKEVLKGDINADTLTGLIGKESKDAASNDKADEKPAEKVLKNLLNF